MALTLIDALTFEHNDDIVELHRRMGLKKTGAATGSAARIVAAGTLPTGCEGGQYAMLLLPINSSQGYFISETYSAPDDGTFWITDVYYKFDDVDMALYGPGEIPFFTCFDEDGNQEWRLVIVGESGPGYLTHRLHFEDSGAFPTRTAIFNDPFTNNLYGKVSVRWKHNADVFVLFHFDDIVLAVVGSANLRFNAGTIKDVYFQGNGMFVDPVNPKTETIAWLVVHFESTVPGDLSTGHLSKLVIDPFGASGTVADCEETGAKPGNALSAGDAQNVYDDTAAVASIAVSLGFPQGTAWSCHRSDVWGGPAGRVSHETKIHGYKFCYFFDGSLDTGDPGLIAGRATNDLATYDVMTVASVQERANKRDHLILRPGDAQFPDADADDWAVIGLEHKAASASTISTERLKIIGIYDADTVGRTILKGGTTIKGAATFNG